MAIYIVIWIAILVPYFLPNRSEWKNFNRNYATFVFGCLAVLIGFRHVTVGADTLQYQYYYSISADKLGVDQRDRGYFLFADFFNQRGLSFQVYNFIVACILAAVLVWFYLSYSKNLGFSILIFMTIGLLSMYMTGIRQSLAITISLVAIQWIDKHKGILHLCIACALIWVASTFHASAVICYAIIALILLRLRLSRPFIFLVVMIAAAALVYRQAFVRLIQGWLPVEYESYDLNANYQINPLLIIISILIPTFCLIFDTEIEKDGKYSREKTWLYLISCANILFTIMARNSMYFSRIAFYFLHVNSILIPNMIEEQRIKSNIYIMYILIGAICMVYFLISIPGGTLQIDNYRFFWQ